VHTSRWEEDDEPSKQIVKSRWHDDEPSDLESQGAEEEGLRSPRHETQGVASGERGALQGGLDVALGIDTEMDIDISKSNDEDPELRKRDMLLECRNKDDFEFLKEIGSGTYGLVSKYACHASESLPLMNHATVIAENRLFIHDRPG
jgi:hypothetical protein